MDKEFALGSSLAALVVIAITGAILVGCSISETEYTKQVVACSNNGGSYIPTGSNNNYQCIINKINK